MRKMRLSGRARFWLLITIALASHLALDGLNSYGIHPFYPFNNRWYFGDAVFILEPWLWLILGVAVAWNGKSARGRLAAALLMLGVVAAAAFAGVVPRAAVAALAIIGGASALIAIRLSPYTRTLAAVVMCMAIVGSFFATSRVARGAVMEALRDDLRGDVLDVILTPNPSSPLCWESIVIERREAADEYVLWRGTVSLMPAWNAPTACASHRLGGRRATRMVGNGRFALRDEIHQPLARLRGLAEHNCWARAWLRFGRAPVIEGDSLLDLRFSERPGREFTDMRVTREGCPPYVPNWEMPRADLLK